MRRARCLCRSPFLKNVRCQPGLGADSIYMGALAGPFLPLWWWWLLAFAAHNFATFANTASQNLVCLWAAWFRGDAHVAGHCRYCTDAGDGGDANAFINERIREEMRRAKPDGGGYGLSARHDHHCGLQPHHAHRCVHSLQLRHGPRAGLLLLCLWGSLFPCLRLCCCRARVFVIISVQDVGDKETPEL